MALVRFLIVFVFYMLAQSFACNVCSKGPMKYCGASFNGNRNACGGLISDALYSCDRSGLTPIFVKRCRWGCQDSGANRNDCCVEDLSDGLIGFTSRCPGN